MYIGEIIMNKPSIFSVFLQFIPVLCVISGPVQLQVNATEDLSPRLILWNVQEKTGTLPVMTDNDFDNVYAVKVPVVKGTYLYRVAIGSEMKPIYGAEGQEGGKALKIKVEDNRIITFFYDPVTHNIVAEVGESFTPARRVVLVGNLQDEFGHTGGPFGGEWDPAAEMTRMQPIGNGFFTFTGTLPVGTYEYKIAIDGSWEENYGQGGKQDGPNIPVKVEQEQEITFYYNDNTHKIADSTWYVMLPEEELPCIIGDVQTAVGTDLILRDDDFDNVYSLSVPLSKGTYSYRVALGTKQQPIYGANAEQDGQPIAFSITEDREVVMYFD
jgi:hypothetical protein